MMFFVPSTGAQLLGLAITPELGSLLGAMGGLIIGTETMNLLFPNDIDTSSIKAVLLVNIITPALGISVDLLGI